MRRLFGWLLLLLGSVAAIVGVAVVVVFGPDSRLTLGPHRLAASGSALVTAPRVLPYAGPTLTLTGTTPNGARPLFIGVGDDVDVRDYLSGTAYTRIDSLSLPWHVQVSTLRGTGGQPANPRDLSWWLTSSVHPGGATVTLPLPDAPVDIVIMELPGTSHTRGFAVDVRVAIGIPGSFAGGLALLVAGGGLLAAGWAVRRAGSGPVPARRRATA
jgi:hypothetical protein